MYLPTSYYKSDKRYPVVYFLAGYQEHVGMFDAPSDSLWAQMQRDGMKEFIIVEADGINTLGGVGGNFYTNSPVTGNAEDFLTKDLVSYIDSTYRTVAKASARGLSGFSMGGSGTINVGLKHPDNYAALYANSAGLLAESGGLKGFLASNGSWASYSAAFFPDLNAPFPHTRPINAREPLENQDPALVKLWESGFGNLRQKVADYLAQPDRLKEIKIAYGTGDTYKWIPAGSEYFLGLLQDNGIPHSSHVFGGAHTVDNFFFDQDCVEFFSKNLTT